MAKILEHGKDSKPKYKYTCQGCNAVVGFTMADTFRHTHSYDYLGGSETDSAVRCPACNYIKILSYHWQPTPGMVTFAE
jgi:hypothetical protein